MIVCHCRGVTDRQIRKAVRDGAKSRNEVVMAYAGGKGCGGCIPLIDAILDAVNESTADGRVQSVPELATG